MPATGSTLLQLSIVLILRGGTPIVHAFSPIGGRGVAPGPPPGVVHPSISNCKRTSPKPKTKSRLNLIDHDLALEMGAARGAFGLCFYGALGVGSIGRELIPIVFRRYESNNNLSLGSIETEIAKRSNRQEAKKKKEEEKTDDMGIKGYPEPIYLSDVLPILSNKMDALSIATLFDERPESLKNQYQYTHLAEEDRVPFLTFDSYRRANPTADPMALRAVFDSFSNSIGGGNVISPITAQERINQYKEDVSAMTKRLNRSKVLGVSAFVFVLLLLGFVDYLTLYHLWRGFFPEWMGFDHMPASLFDGSIGIGVLPRYFVLTVPDV
mmetsp:Transcript_24160/g.58374  ORF Transcript_24160/g.58374 Transcript_24160/m.58374 type:complete len:325 (+) Transcript_24160:75-1049(+)